MLVKKSWERFSEVPKYQIGGRNGSGVCYYRHDYTGWFLLGILPLFILRETTRLNG